MLQQLGIPEKQGQYPLRDKLIKLLNEINDISGSFGKDKEGLIKCVEKKYNTKINAVKWNEEKSRFDITILAYELIRICQGRIEPDSSLNNRQGSFVCVLHE